MSRGQTRLLAPMLNLLLCACGGPTSPTTPPGQIRSLLTSPEPTRPEITFFDWDAYGPTGYHACPLQDESVSVDCRVEDRDGDALTITLRLENLGPGSISGPTEVSQSFPPSPYPREIGTSFVLKSPIQADVRATCRAVDSRGSEARSSLMIPCAS